MARIRWTYEAEVWLKDIYDYIAQGKNNGRIEKLMKNNEPADVLKARELLRRYEKEPNHKTRLRYFEDALALCANISETLPPQ